MGYGLSNYINAPTLYASCGPRGAVNVLIDSLIHLSVSRYITANKTAQLVFSHLLTRLNYYNSIKDDRND